MKKSFSHYFHYLYIFADIIVGFIIVYLPFLTNFGFDEINPATVPAALIYTACNVGLVVIFFAIFKIYKMLTSDFGIIEAVKIALIALGIQLIGLIVITFVPHLPKIENFIFGWILSTIALIFSLPALRMLVRLSLLVFVYRRKKNTIRTLVVGAGSAGKIVVDESRRNVDNHNKVVAFIDDDKEKINGSFAGLPVKGPISKINSVIEYYDIEEVVIAIADLTKERLREIIAEINSNNVRIRRMPLLTEMEGPNDHKIVDIDLDELLCRPPVILDNTEVNEMLSNKIVMVTGAGGSIGSELVRQIFKTHPKTLILFDIYENSTYDIQQQLRMLMREQNINDIELVTLIGSTYNEVRVEQIIKKYRPDYIYHAAAYKHVPLMEDSPAEAIRTNVIGTYNVARLADKYGVKKMVLVSTDKAVRPTNVMGATKRFAETIIQYFSDKSKNTAYAAVRFGNVLGSNGSVVPLFKKQIESGGPITLTDKEIIRYFMTIPEAVSLILQCGLFANGGEIFILDMGKPVKIIDLAEKLIRQSGLVPYKDIDIVVTGLRPGEKLYEELLLDKNTQQRTKNEKIFVEAKGKIFEIEKEIETISVVFNMDSQSDVKSLLSKIIDTYCPQK
ncbi:MAG: polysaccharide biosynthesis protein [Bacilli bacterium]|nr:polysaccharide biosynthesis protein [Bacilli bacterium]